MFLIVNFYLGLVVEFIFLCCKMVAMENETHMLVGFCYDKFVYDSNVDFHEVFQVLKIWHVINLSTNVIITIDPIFLCIFYWQESMIIFTSSTLEFCYKEKSSTCPNNVFVEDNN